MPRYSVVIPAYNEEANIITTLTKVITFMDGYAGGSYEIVIVDDASTDNTVKLVQDYIVQDKEKLQSIIHLVQNPHKGKGYTVRTGMLVATGQLVLMCDADLATPIEELKRLELWVNEHDYDVVIASREGVGAQRNKEPFYRHLMGRVFNLIIRLITLPGIQDTQCGFKLFKGEVAKDVFSRLILFGDLAPEIKVPRVSAFDVEVLVISKRRGYSIKEVPITWHYVPTVRVSALRDSLSNLFDVLKVKANDLKGLYGKE